MAWVYAVVFIVALVASYAMMPKPQSQPPAALADIQAPTADDGREIPVLFGTRDIAGYNVVWYGDLRAVAVRKSGGKK